MPRERPLTAQEIYDRAPIGSLIRYSDGQPPPPKTRPQMLRAWQRRNKQGTLIRKAGPGPHGAAPYFVLRVDETGFVVSDEHIGLANPLRFDIIWRPSAPTTPF